MENKDSYLESFYTWDDAIQWVESIMSQYSDDWIMEECRVNYIGLKWRAGVSFKKAQLEMFYA